MKTKLLLILSTLCIVMLSCTKQYEAPDLSNDYPRILGGWPAYDSYGRIGNFNVTKGDSLYVELQFTPAHLCKGVWYLDNRAVAEGNIFHHEFPNTGIYRLKIEVTTERDTTYREANVMVRNNNP